MPATEPVGALAGAMLPVPHRVASTHTDLPGTVTLGLEALDGPLPPFRAGQFDMLWGFGTGEVPISISGDPTRQGPVLHTIRTVSSATRALCAVRVDDVVGVRGPFGNGWDLAPARGGDVVLVAGGIGVAPLRPVLYEILADRAAYGRVIVLLGARSPSDLLYAAEIEQWRGRLDLDVHVTVDHADERWRGDVGVVTRLLARVPFEPPRTTAFVCGPEVMMRFAAVGLRDLGVDPARIELSLERNMKCGVGHCGHCQLGPTIVCRDGPVYTYDRVGPLMAVRGL
jgi:NAD(P)H-flavin reductase